MNEVMQKLYELYEMDKKIFEIKRHMGNLPEDRKVVQVKYDEMTKHANVLREEKETLINEMKEFNAKKDEYKKEIDSDKDYLANVKSNEEYMMVLNSIDKMEEELKNGSETIIKNNRRIEEIEIDLKKYVENESSAKGLRQELEKFNKELEDDENKIVDLKSERESLVNHLPEDIKKKYERIYIKRRGIAISLINSALCSGCFSEIPQQLVQNVRMMEKINYCINCGRILLWSKDENSS